MRLTVLKNNVPINEVLVDTSDSGERYEIYVGRSEDCHVLIDDPLISRHHFVLKNETGNWYCDKLSQLGAVSVNGQASGRMEFREGDEIKCGLYSILVHDLPRGTRSAHAPQNSGPVFFQEPKPQVQTYAPEPEPLALEPELLEMDSFADVSGDVKLDDGVTLETEDDVLSLGDLDDKADDLFLDDSDDHNGGSSSGSSSNGPDDSFMELESGEAENLPADSFNNNELTAFSDGNVIEADGSAEEKTSFIKAFVNYQLVLFGAHAPYDRYQVDSSEVFIGRDPKKCQIVLDDPEVSTVHAVLRKSLNDVTLEDLNSSNGTILNGDRINRSLLATGDEFLIGSTSFKLETRSELLEAEFGRLMPVEKDQSIDREEIEEELVDEDEGFATEAAPNKSIIAKFKNDPKFRFRAILGMLLLLGAYFSIEDETPAPQPDKAATAKVDPAKDKNAKPKLQLNKELEEKRNMSYELGVNFFEQNKYFEALKEFQIVMEIDSDYKKVSTYFEQTKEGLKRLAELESQKRAEEDRLKTKKLIEEILVKAREAVKERQVTLAENYFSQVTEKDPENIEVQQLKMELEAWQKEQERVALEKATVEAARKAMVDALSPGKTFYLKKEWYRSILKLEEFMRRKGVDEDLVKEGSDMLADAKTQLASELGPLIGKARSLKEGQDLKNAYEAFLDVLKVEPTNTEALNEVDEIRTLLETRSKKLYREAIIAESLSLFTDAKEKFQEVQQVSPSDSDYYRKASEKLKNYLE